MVKRFFHSLAVCTITGAFLAMVCLACIYYLNYCLDAGMLDKISYQLIVEDREPYTVTVWIENPITPTVTHNEPTVTETVIVQKVENTIQADDFPVVIDPVFPTVDIDSNSQESDNKSEPVVEYAVEGKPLSDNIAHQFALENQVKYANFASETLELINAYRVESGVPALEFDDTASILAMHRAAENAWVNCFITATINGNMRHIRPNGRIAATVMEYYNVNVIYSENMGRFQRNPEEIFTGWKESPAHNKLMLSNSATKGGIGVAQNSAGYYYWVLVCY